MTEFLWVIIALPLAGAVFLHFFSRFMREPLAGWLASMAIGGSFAVAVVAALPFLSGGEHGETLLLWEWIPALGANIEILWDPLSALMTLIVTGVGTLIHIFAIGYMHGDERFGRFFTYLNLFAASMLTLVLAGNYAMLFIGWELVGLCSYLLIGFWFTRHAPAAAAKKAFVVNRIGDFGLMVGLMLVFTTFGTLSYSGIFDRAPELLTAGTATAIGLLFLLGAAGKSAQIPLYVWLPDAMEGPTPVSALIHAATMVTAGVYLITRSAAIYDLSVTAQVTVATIGAATAIWAASIAMAQRDIKKVLAYSTVSQLGYMFLAVGTTAYVAGVFHLMTHAFFKALLFLGAGSVIHAMGGEQDMHKMGGLRKSMPVTAWTMAIGTIAIAGIPPFAGFWSKDEILASAFARGGWFSLLWIVGLITALLTAFYMTRQWVLVFWGEPRWSEGTHPHESPRVMTFPLVALAVLSVIGGLLNTPVRRTLEHYLEPVFEMVTLQHPPEGLPMFVLLAGLSVLAALAGMGAAFITYRQPAENWRGFEQGFEPLWGTWEEAYRVDDIYGKLIVAPGKKAAETAAFAIDLPVIDGAVNGVARLVRSAGDWVRPLQTGFVRNYGALFLAGTVVVVVWLVMGS
ncbi:MAG TPA: NADH-quinone oxidoreductase subunit L [Acidimicrobiia bacterium]|jgi:NADH-quinone oxidoreductase subunit L|nr:NADH-quinone oxidoreductase subunit L [Acidimicrobiia bacterium]